MHIGVGLLDGLGGYFGLVVGNRRIEMVGNVRGTNLVVQKVNESPRIKLVVGAIDRVQGTLYVGVVVMGKVRNVDIRVLEPTKFAINNKSISKKNK